MMDEGELKANHSVQQVFTLRDVTHYCKSTFESDIYLRFPFIWYGLKRHVNLQPTW